MKNKKKILGVSGIALVILLLIFVNSLVGNPISNSLAKKAAREYIDENYSSLDLEIQRSSYNFKFGEYLVFAQSSTSEDTTFAVRVNSLGRVLRDDYQNEVANNLTTYRRLAEELRETAKEIIGNTLEYDFENILLSFVEEGDWAELERDMELDINDPPLPLEISVTLFSEDLSFMKIAEVAKGLEAVMAEQAIPVAEYSVRILPLSEKPQKENQAVSWVNSLSISYFPQELMTAENLPQVMEQFEADRVAELNKSDKKQ